MIYAYDVIIKTMLRLIEMYGIWIVLLVVLFEFFIAKVYKQLKENAFLGTRSGRSFNRYNSKLNLDIPNFYLLSTKKTF